MTENTKETRISILLSILIGTCILLIFIGLIMFLFGSEAHSLFELEVSGAKLTTKNTGLPLIFIGSMLAYLLIKNIPKNTSVFTKSRTMKKESKLNLVLFPLIFLAICSLIIIIRNWL